MGLNLVSDWGAISRENVYVLIPFAILALGAGAIAALWVSLLHPTTWFRKRKIIFNDLMFITAKIRIYNYKNNSNYLLILYKFSIPKFLEIFLLHLANMTLDVLQGSRGRDTGQ